MLYAITRTRACLQSYPRMVDQLVSFRQSRRIWCQTGIFLLVLRFFTACRTVARLYVIAGA